MKQSKLLKKLLTVSERSFITIDRQFMITDSSYGAERFSEHPYESLINKDIRDSFPEIIGLEESFNNIWLNEATNFEIKGVCRSVNPQKPLYFDFYVIGTNELEEEDKNIIICIEDATDMMMMSQTLMQRANESELLANDLLKSKEYIDKVISAMAEALIVTDHQGRIKTVNPAALHLFGYSIDELVDRSIYSLFKNPKQLDIIHQNYLESHSNNLTVDKDRYFTNIEILYLSKSNEEILMSFSCSTIQNQQFKYNTVANHDFVYVGHNITELKQKEKELISARKFAEQSAKAKSTFLANMSHEIRTPMNGVLGMTDLLLGTSLDEMQQDFAENILLSGNLLLSLINRILDLSKLEEGELQLESLPFNLEQCVEEILELFGLQAHNQGLELNACFEEGLPILLMADTVRFRQIMMNLIGNAIKFTAKGEIVVQVERDRSFEQTSHLENNNSPESPIYLRFSVIDTGIGIDPSNQDKLFKPFSQVDISTNRQFGGTGLGLAISRQLVELMQGEIGIFSPVAKGEGTCFWFRIPFTLQPQSIPVSQSLNYDRQTLNKRNILVIDANRHARNAIRYYLTKFGAEIHEASNPIEAIARLDSGQQVDVVLIDWRLIDSERSELVQQILTRSQFTKLPLIVMLTANRQGEIQTFIDQGFCGYVTKPFKEQRLLKAIFLALGISIPNPVSDSPFTGISVIKNQANSPDDGKENLKNTKILLAEDNIVNQKITMAYLSQLSCQADLAENGEQVLQLIKTKDYDIILMDCQMPLLDGYATTQAIRQLEANGQLSKHIVIIAMTANAFIEDRDRCLEVGMDDYVSKPIRRQKLKETLENWIK